MEHEAPETLDYISPRAGRWLDFVAGLDSLKRFAAIEAERERSREYERVRKQQQRAGRQWRDPATPPDKVA